MEYYHSIIGLPRSGKTTFLAALWHLIEADEVDTHLVLDKLEGDSRYLNSISSAWRECKPVTRTSQGGEVGVKIHAKFSSTEQRIILGFPDLSGESFERQFATRQVRPEYVDGFSQDGGVIVFVSANRSVDGLTIADLGCEILQESPADIGSPDPIVTWKHEMVPQQVQLVDILQMLQRGPFNLQRRKLALVVSAWDVISDSTLSPAEWLAREMPFLNQFLTHNPNSFEFKVWGVSAQGGDISGGLRTKLLSLTPSQRLRCVGDSGENHDITTPIFWLSEA